MLFYQIHHLRRIQTFGPIFQIVGSASKPKLEDSNIALHSAVCPSACGMGSVGGEGREGREEGSLREQHFQIPSKALLFHRKKWDLEILFQVGKDFHQLVLLVWSGDEQKGLLQFVEERRSPLPQGRELLSGENELETLFEGEQMLSPLFTQLVHTLPSRLLLLVEGEHSGVGKVVQSEGDTLHEQLTLLFIEKLVIEFVV